MVWPSHPQLAGFFLTVVATVAVRLTWPTDKSKTPKNPKPRWLEQLWKSDWPTTKSLRLLSSVTDFGIFISCLH